MSKIQAIRKKADDDFFFFSKEIVGLSKMSETPHREMCDHLIQTEKPYNMALWPRGSFKSSVRTVAYCLYRMRKDPDVRILLASETQKNSQRYVKEIKTHIEKNQRLRKVYGDWVGNTLWRDDEFIIATRRNVKREPTLMPSSLEKGTIVGMHYDLIILDDVVSKNNINTPEQIAKTIDYFKLLISILDPGGQIVINGTRWSVHDLYGWIMDPENGFLHMFDSCVKEAVNDDWTEFLMPNILNEEFLRNARTTQGEYIFNCQYRNKTLSEENSAFKASDIMRYQSPPSNRVYFMTVDPAVSQSRRSDYSGVLVVGVDVDHRYWVEEALPLKVDPAQLIEVIFEMAAKYQPMMCLVMEKFVLETFLRTQLIREMELRDFTIPLKEIPTNNRISKEARIRALQPKFERKEIFIKQEHDMLYFQIVNFPQLKHDDLIDGLKNFLSVTFPADPKEDDKIIETKRYEHLPEKQQKIWKKVEDAVRRKVRRKKWVSL